MGQGGHDSPPPVYIVSPPAYVAPPEYNNLETGEHLVADSAPGSRGETRKEELPPSYQQLFPSSTLATWLPPIEIVPTHPLQPPEIQQHVPYGLPQPPRGIFVAPPRNSTYRERMDYIRRFNNIVHPLSDAEIQEYKRIQRHKRWVLSCFMSAMVL